MISLTVEKREKTGKKVSALRAAGTLPAVVYGPKQESIPLEISSKAFESVFKEVGESSVIELNGVGSPIKVLVHSIDYDPVTSIPRHVDFYAIEKGAKVQVAIPVVFVGESPAIKLGANIIKTLHEIEIEADATNIPHEITLDVSILENIGDQIRVGDIKLPSGVTLVTGEEEAVVIAQEVKEEVEEESDTPDMDSIEVEKKGKEESEEEPAK